jgi:ubiquinone/menaquinone biosynthesis C-methylase UbiE
MSKSKSRPTNQPPVPRYLCEAEVVTGLKNYAADELRARFGTRVTIYEKTKPEEVPFSYDGDLSSLLMLTKTVAVYLAQHYPIPRPLALLGHQHFQGVLRQISTVRSMHPGGTFNTFRIAAAGSDSSVFTRIKGEIQQATGLIPTEDEADFVLRVRKSDLQPQGWDVLARISPRPLSARAWRVCDMEGALNATIASAMIEMTHPRPDDRFLNIMCGSGTLIIERRLRAPVDVIGGCDTNPIVLRCAADNIRASGFADQIDLFEMDATNLQLPGACIDVICADLPWGQLVGSHEENMHLYPLVLAEAARVAAPGARAAFITHELRLIEKLLGDFAHYWKVKSVVRVFQGGLHPKIYVLERT